ncbi:MAG: hypothetical protein J6B71_01655, partial [Clostridia bacterium]|nr:hypothetical protein [Clostridia bacterium]
TKYCSGSRWKKFDRLRMTPTVFGGALPLSSGGGLGAFLPLYHPERKPNFGGLSPKREAVRRCGIYKGRNAFADPNAVGVALPMVGFDCSNAALWRLLRSG